MSFSENPNRNERLAVYEISSKAYAVSGYVENPQTGQSVPLVELPQMTDERWHKLSRENAVRNYTRESGRAPETSATAVAWQREVADSLINEKAQQNAPSEAPDEA